MKELHKNLLPWINTKAQVLSSTPKGFRDLMWCPYMNEPAILEWDNNEDEPRCPYCRTSFEAETHTFLGHIGKPV